jgi:hypothetical protein
MLPRQHSFPSGFSRCCLAPSHPHHGEDAAAPPCRPPDAFRCAFDAPPLVSDVSMPLLLQKQRGDVRRRPTPAISE